MTSDETLWLNQQVEFLKDQYSHLKQKREYITTPSEIIMLPVSDEVSLFTVCCKPSGNGPFPTIIMRSCYPLHAPLYDLHADEFCKRGFAFVYQYCRGTGYSEGKWVPNIYDRKDGKVTLEWLANQKWVESIGYWGSSYMAFTGWVVADILPEKVKTLYLTHYGTDRFTSAYQCGMFRQDVLTAWTMGNAGFPIRTDYLESLKFRPQVLVDEKLWGTKIDWYRDWITNTNRNDKYWNVGFWKELSEIPSFIKIPVYMGEGWYDHHLGSALKTYESLSMESKSHSVLRIGSWNHGFGACVQGHVCNHLENCDVQTAMDWFEMILQKKVIPQGKIMYYQIGSDSWNEEPSYPFVTKNKREYFFSTKERNFRTCSLTKLLKTEIDSVTYTYNPENPVMSHGCESLLATFSEIGSLLQPENGWRNDVISFISEPIQNDINILGKVQVKLYVSSSAEDTAFTAKLIEILPDGKAYNIRSGITTLAYRLGTDFPRLPYIPGTIVEVLIDMWDISWKLSKDSRLRVDISSSDFPQYSIHTNYAGIWAEQCDIKTAQQTLYSGKEYPSSLVLPIK